MSACNDISEENKAIRQKQSKQSEAKSKATREGSNMTRFPKVLEIVIMKICKQGEKEFLYDVFETIVRWTFKIPYNAKTDILESVISKFLMGLNR